MYDRGVGTVRRGGGGSGSFVEPVELNKQYVQRFIIPLTSFKAKTVLIDNNILKSIQNYVNETLIITYIKFNV